MPTTFFSNFIIDSRGVQVCCRKHALTTGLTINRADVRYSTYEPLTNNAILLRSAF